MGEIGNIVIYIVMICAVLGAFAAIKNEESGLGKEFMTGLHSIGYIFIPVAGIMASIPYLSLLISKLCGPFFELLHADPSMAATSVIAVDMGGYHLAYALAQNKESWIMAMVTGTMAGATIVFSIPVGLSMLEKKDHKYMALGIMSGILSIPFGVLVTSIILLINQPLIRGSIATNTESLYPIALSMGTLFGNLLPLIIFVSLLAFGLKIIPNMMIRGFMVFGRLMDVAIKIILVFSIVEYFTGFFRKIMGKWGFDPIIADKEDQFRALEIAGYIGVMLSGAFPMVYLIKKYFSGPLEKCGTKIGLETAGAAGLFATIANILAMFRLVKDMRPKDKVINIAFAVCAAFLFGDHLAFTANFQPNLVVPIMVGKLSGGIVAFILATFLSVPIAEKLDLKTLPLENA